MVSTVSPMKGVEGVPSGGGVVVVVVVFALVSANRLVEAMSWSQREPSESP
jgi:hypothetical protein